MKRRSEPKTEDIPITLKINSTLVERLDEEAKAQRRTKKVIVELALESFFGMAIEPK